MLPYLALVLLAADADLAEFAEKVKPSVVVLEELDGHEKPTRFGTGFFISADGRCATNAHVIEGASNLYALMHDGDRRPVLGVLLRDETHDLAVVQVAPRADGKPDVPLPLGDSKNAREGTPVVMMGSPRGFGWTLSDGIVSAYRPKGLPADVIEYESDEKWKEIALVTPMLQITAPGTHGSSGSPVLTLNGEVVGVMESGMDVGNLGFAVMVEALKDGVAGLGAEPKVVPFDNRARWNLIGSLAFATVLLGAVAVRRLRRRRRGFGLQT